MDAAFNYMLKIIRDEIRNCEEILEFLFEKEKCIIKNDVILIKEMSFKEHALFVKARELEVSRFSILEVVANKLKLDPKKTTMKILAEKTTGEIKTEVISLRENLNSLLSKIKRQNFKCELLLKKSIEIINYSIGIFTGQIFNKTRQMYDQNCQSEKHYSQVSLVDQRG